MRPAELIDADDIRGDGRKKQQTNAQRRSQWEAGGRQWRARCKLSEWESKQPRASGGSKSKHTPTPLCKEKKKTLWYSSNGNRWERSFTAGASACYRGHKSAAWHRVSSVSQQSQDCGHVSINGPTDELTARDEQAERRPRTTTSSAWDTTHRKERHISSFIKRRKTETTTRSGTSEKQQNANRAFKSEIWVIRLWRW